MRRPTNPLTKTTFLARTLLAVVAVCLCATASYAAPNILLITADDLNCDSVGAFGCPVPDTTPNIDRLASEGMRFERAHVNIAVCQPCRSVWLSGRYSHRSGGEGFHTLNKPGIPLLPELLRESGYAVGILGKVGHCTPYPTLKWDMKFDMGGLGRGRNPAIYAQRAKEFIEANKKAGRPFFLMANSHDPHRPFYGNDGYKDYGAANGPQPPTKIFKPADVAVPGFLPDVPKVRLEVSEYFSSVRRCDDTVGALLHVLEESGLADDTLVIFLSDHGMALPFAKTNCYYHSTRTPWIVRWPGKIEAGTVNESCPISGVDMMPTLLEAAGCSLPDGLDGQSIVPLLNDKTEDSDRRVFTQFHQTAGRKRYPMRSIIDQKYAYIYSLWSDGEVIFRNESQAGRTMRAMVEAAKTDEAIARRVELFLHRVPEELYDIENDPDALNNLIDDPKYKAVADRLRGELLDWMKKVDDPAQVPMTDQESEAVRQTFMHQQNEAVQRPAARHKK